MIVPASTDALTPMVVNDFFTIFYQLVAVEDSLRVPLNPRNGRTYMADKRGHT